VATGNPVEKVRGEEWRREDPIREDPALQEMTRKMNAKQLALFTAWVMNGRNLSAAARAVGYHPSYAHTLMKSSPVFERAAEYANQKLEAEDKEWIECLPDARQTLRSLMRNSKDDKVRYLAAKDIVDRAEGKPVAKVDMQVRDERPSITDEEMQMAFSLMQQAGWTFPQAMEWMRSHPEKVQQWVGQNVKMLEVAQEEEGDEEEKV